MIGEAIRIARSFNGLSQQAMARAMNVSNGYLSQIESGDREPSQETLRAAAKALRIPTSTLLFFSEQLSGEEGADEAQARAAFGRKILAALAAIDRTAG